MSDDKKSAEVLNDLYAGPPAASIDFHSSLGDIQSLIEKQSPEEEIFDKIVTACTKTTAVEAAVIFMLREPNSHELELSARSGTRSIPAPVTSSTKSGTMQAVQIEQTSHNTPYVYFRIRAQRKTVGWLGAYSPSKLSTIHTAQLESFAFLAGIARERPQTSAQLQHFQNKLEVLTELNKLVASGSSLERVARALAKEAAFRFSADCALGLLLEDSGEILAVRGKYGCPPRSVADSVEFQNNHLGRALKLGGIISVPDLNVQHDHGLNFLLEIGIKSAHISSIHIKGEGLGAIIIGFRSRRDLSEFEGDVFEEFTRGAAVAIASAKNREQLSKYAGKLEELVEERTHDLAVQTARADEANQAKSRFVANMSHELRTPLTAIVGYSSVVAEGIFGPVNQEQKDALNAIAKAAEHLKELINDVLDVSKIEAGKEDPEPAEVEIYNLLEQVFKLMMQTAMGKNIKLSPVDAPPDSELRELKAWVDPRHIRQIMINLVSNAVKYTPSGGKVSLHIKKMGDKCKITVRDTGIGLSPAQVDKVFERFGRGDDSYSRTQVGTGIGLSLTKRLIEMNGGKIGVRSEVNKGSDFWILVPLASEENIIRKDSSGVEAEESLTATRLDGLNILIVDDNLSTCEVLETIIRSVGGNPYSAYSVQEAKKVAEQTALDTALVDLAIPGENGIELIKYFRKQCSKPLSTMPLIVVTACVFDSDREEAMQHGASEFIAKPFSPAKIVKTIRDLTTASVVNSF